jgi:ferric-dicitrate binding protein FerR (iron transport regulator)
MTTQHDRETIAARWLIEQDDPGFSDAQREELSRWLMQSVENCDTYVRLVRAWRWTVLLYRDEPPLTRSKRPGQRSGTSDTSSSSRKVALDRRFGNLLRARRHQLGLSQAELAARAGMHVSRISQIEAGTRALTLTSTYVLARALEIAPSRLVAQLEKLMSGKPRAPRTRK